METKINTWLKHPRETVLAGLIMLISFALGWISKELPEFVKAIAKSLPPLVLLMLAIVMFLFAVLFASLYFFLLTESKFENRFGALWKYNKRTKLFDPFPYCPVCKNGLTNYVYHSIPNVGSLYAFDCIHCKSYVSLSSSNGATIKLDEALKLLNKP